ncbi:hypothetical protein H5410_025290 [Solanum commersonii]|uniref:Uncharacterized protein n=1 Tax=Solanum commersonii TaxID=4109 RepID=A0A9J5YY38_SOLCO|nr:hypothetical protein H5410_025290 [Solanum commersonii]
MRSSYHLVFGLDAVTKDYIKWKNMRRSTHLLYNTNDYLMEGPPDGHGVHSWAANLMLLGDSICILNLFD